MPGNYGAGYLAQQNAIRVRQQAAAKKAAALALQAKNAKGNKTGSKNPVGIEFNLPPNKNSLPLMLSKQGLPIGDSSAGKIPASRRSAMWFFDVAGVNGLGHAKDAKATAGSTFMGATSAAKADGSVDAGFLQNFSYGFQWLWNPDKVGSKVEVNPEVVPSPMDGTANLSGLFSGMESVTVSARINRVVDMAMIRGKVPNLSSYYMDNYPGAKIPKDISAQLKMLEERGTMADLEYIYRMCNGLNDGKGKANTNALGVVTSDTAFLSPTPVVLKIGTGALSYVGWLNSITISHTMFTWDMIPIDTTIDLQLSTFATTSLQS